MENGPLRAHDVEKNETMNCTRICVAFMRIDHCVCGQRGRLPLCGPLRNSVPFILNANDGQATQIWWMELVIHHFIHILVYEMNEWILLLLTVKSTDRSVPSSRIIRHGIRFLLVTILCALIWLLTLLVSELLVPAPRPFRRLRKRSISIGGCNRRLCVQHFERSIATTQSSAENRHTKNATTIFGPYRINYVQVKWPLARTLHNFFFPMRVFFSARSYTQLKNPRFSYSSFFLKIYYVCG